MSTKKTPDTAFFGTDEFAVSVLRELSKAGCAPSLIVTAPDKPRGRGLKLSPSPSKAWAQEHGIAVCTPSDLKNVETTCPALLKKELFVVASYGGILPAKVLALPVHGSLNVHPSLLPKYRGPSPIQATILSGEKKTGVTIILMDEKVDHGEILAQEEIALAGNESYTELAERLATLGGRLIAEVVPKFVGGGIKLEAQAEGQATFTKKVTKEMGLIALEGDAQENFRKYRALSVWPGTYFFTKNGLRVKIAKAELRDGLFTPLRVVPESKREMDYEDFKRGSGL